MPGAHDQAGDPAEETTPPGIDLGLGLADVLDEASAVGGPSDGVGVELGASVADVPDPVGAALGDVVGDEHDPSDGVLDVSDVLAVDDLGLDVSGTFADVDGTDLADVSELTRSLHDPDHDPAVAHGLLDDVLDDVLDGVVDLFDDG